MTLTHILSLGRGILPPSDQHFINRAAARPFVGRDIHPPFGALFYQLHCHAQYHWKEVSVHVLGLIFISCAVAPAFTENRIHCAFAPTLLIELSRTISQNTVFIALQAPLC